MVSKLLVALLLIAACVVIHASGITLALRRLPRSTQLGHRFWPSVSLFIRLAAWIIACHLIEILAWALLYLSYEAMPHPESAFYFSAVTYTTTGYGDLVLSPEWRFFSGIEALTGILMCGWSTAFFVMVVSRVRSANAEPSAH